MSYIDVKDLYVEYVLSRDVFSLVRDKESLERLLKQYEVSQWYLEKMSSEKSLTDKLRKLFEEAFERFNKTDQISIYALDGLNLKVERGKFLSVVGESGSGKSTFALALLGIFPKNAKVRGTIKIEDMNMLSAPEEMRVKMRARKIGYIGELSKKYLNPLMFSALQVLEAALVASDKISEAVKKMKWAAEKAGVDKRTLLAMPDQLSLGQISKVAYALAISKTPELLIADEPFRGLDIYQASVLARFLRDIAEEHSATTILFTHRVDLALEISDEIAIMYRGKILEKGPVEKIYRKPIHPFTKGLIGAIPSIKHPKKELTSIPGETLPNLVSINFCPFYNRCPVRKDECLEEMPKMEEIDGQYVACYMAEEIKDIKPIDFWKE